MKYFVLLYILPPEIINIIYNFILEYNSAFLIYHHLKFYTKKQKVMLISITEILNYNINKFSNLKHILCLEHIYDNYYSKDKYSEYFWQCYLNLMSTKIMDLHNTILINSNPSNLSKSNNLKRIIHIWFKLCRKYNISFKLAIKAKPYNISHSKWNVSYVNSNNINIIKNFKNFVYAPIILENYDPINNIYDELYINDSFRYLWMKFLQ